MYELQFQLNLINLVMNPNSTTAQNVANVTLALQLNREEVERNQKQLLQQIDQIQDRYQSKSQAMQLRLGERVAKVEAATAQLKESFAGLMGSVKLLLAK
jgi:hypothetical protein